MGTNAALQMLSPEEWNAAYFLGLEAVFRDDCRCNVCQQVHEGVRVLTATGYRFRRRVPDSEGGPGSDSAAVNMHERNCQEIAKGAFDTVGRARSAVRWLKDKVPDLNTRWIEGLVQTYDRVHAGATRSAVPAPGEGVAYGES